MDRAASIRAFRTAAINLARGMSAQTELALGNVDAALVALQNSLSADLATPRVRGVIEGAQGRSPEAMGFLAAGADGRIIDARGGAPAAAQAQAVQEALAHFRTSGGNAPYVTFPAKSDDGWVAFMARRIDDRDGRLAGAVLAEISLRRWLRISTASPCRAATHRHPLPAGRARCWRATRRSGTARVRHWLPARSGTPPSQPAAGPMRHPTCSTARPSWRRCDTLRGMPLVIETSISEQEALAGWRSQRQWTALAGLAGAAGGGRAAARVRTADAQARTLGDVPGSEEFPTGNRAAAIQRGSQQHFPGAVLLLSADMKLIVCNSRYGEIYGYPPEIACPGTTLDEILALSSIVRSLTDTVRAAPLRATDVVPGPGEPRRSMLELRRRTHHFRGANTPGRRRLGGDARRRHRAAQGGGAGQVSGASRSADRPAEPGAVPGLHRPGACRPGWRVVVCGAVPRSVRPVQSRQ